MKKAAAFLLFMALAGTAFADGSQSNCFFKRESDRSGVTGTVQMVGNSIGGFFSQLGSRLHPSKKSE